MDSKIAELINDQINKEFYSAYLYLDFANYYGSVGLDGFENWYTPEAKVYHVGSATTGTRYNEKKVFLAARNTIFVIYKNMPLLQLFINLPFILA